jgi:hypothetical protein
VSPKLRSVAVAELHEPVNVAAEILEQTRLTIESTRRAAERARARSVDAVEALEDVRGVQG